MATVESETPNQTPIASGILAPAVPAELPRAEFSDEGEIAGEPATDRKIVLEDGTALRERIVNTGANAENATPNASPTAVAFTITNTLLDSNGAVTTDQAGRPLVTSRHEVVFTAEHLGNLGSPEAVNEALDDARRIAASRAQREFVGFRLLETVLAARSPLPTDPALPAAES